MNFFESLVRKVGVDLRGRNTRVPKHFLHGPDICTVLQKFCRKGVTERVWCHLLHDACSHRDSSDDAFDGLWLESPLLTSERVLLRPIGITDEEGRPDVVSGVQVRFDVLYGGIGKEHDPRLSPFSYDPELSRLQVHIFPI